ncbi:MAG: DUF4147 domain-containing protein [Chloroflexi bacterium]|nr:DUF4147 domain-containing protein [Chloroflexota bacterium]MBU1660337.1 DUF4147 domain-containing protein [Chloroflexota bacterium]
MTNLPITNLPITNLPITNLPISIFPASHPVPDERSVAGAQKIIDLLSTTTANDLVICLISGGGSALLTSPVAGISLTDLQSLTSALLACGATINEINTLRKHLSRVKGGQLARWIAPARSATLILSDVVGDPLDVVASGPTVPDSSTYADALAVVDKYNLGAQIPPAIMTHLQSGANGNIPETPKPGDPVFKRAENSIIGNNLQAAQAAIEQAKAEGFNTLLLTTSLQGEARAAGRMLAAVARQIAATGDPIPRPACIVAGGETTVTLSLPHPQPLSQGERGVFLPLPLGAPFGDDKGRGEGGLGGRNQELALAAVSELAGLPDVMLIALATDGDDGPTDAAGAVVTGETLARARELGLDPAEFLARNDSYHFFEPLGDLLKPGPTQTNVCDLTFIFAF